MNKWNSAVLLSALLSFAVTHAPELRAAESAPTQASSAAPPDAGLYTSYYFFNGFSNLSFSVCGYLPESDGCYGSGSFGPFGHVGAMVEGFATYSGNSVQRRIYIVDTASGESGMGVTLYVYQKTDLITDAAYDHVSTKFETSIALPLLGGSTALCSMAANENFVFIGTNQGPNAAIVKKGSWTITQAGGFSPPINVSSITTNDYGYVTVAFSNGTSGEFTGNIEFGPDGEFEGDGGGATFMLTSHTGISTTTEQLPTFDSVQTLRPIVLRPHRTASPATASP